MKVLICGSRDWTDTQAVYDRIRALPINAIVIEGEAEGADLFARQEAERRGLFVARVPVATSHWRLYGRAAGHMRNAVMLALAPDLVIAFQRNRSAGTQCTIENAKRIGIPVEVHTA